jgi:magnesium-protoporphyrin O-methyltransferase
MTHTLDARRAELEVYFDRTASATWEKLTSSAPVSGIRATVRAGRAAMHETILSWLPESMTGLRVLDAGCGTGTFARTAAARGAEVVAIDIAASLVSVAAERLEDAALLSRIDWRVGDMTDPELGVFDYVVALDSIIHYEPEDMGRMIGAILPRVRRAMIFTHAPRTPLLTAMHAAGKLFPRSDRSPAIVPVKAQRLARLIEAETDGAWRAGRRHRVNSGFYISEAMEVVRS